MKKTRKFIAALLPEKFSNCVSAVRRSHEMRVEILGLKENMRWQAQTIGTLLNRIDSLSTTSLFQGWEHCEFKALSQHGEDGLLRYIFDTIGETNRQVVEFGCGDGRECNAAYLLLFRDWRGLLMDANPQNVHVANRFYSTLLKEKASNVLVVNTRVTVDNINRLIGDNGFVGEIDLLSVDIDGNDYWLWKAIDRISPRVVVVEYNASFGAERSVTIPYDSEFCRGPNPDRLYYGASLRALETLGKQKGYALVGCDRSGVNAFFVREELVTEPLTALTSKDAFRPQLGRIYEQTQQEQEAQMRSFPLVDL